MSHRFLLFSWLTSVLFWEQHTLLMPSDEWRYKGGDFSDLSQWQDIGMRELSETPQVIQSAPCQDCNKAGHWHLPDSTLESSSSAHPSPFFLPSRPLASSSRLLLPNSQKLPCASAGGHGTYLKVKECSDVPATASHKDTHLIPTRSPCPKITWLRPHLQS